MFKVLKSIECHRKTDTWGSKIRRELEIKIQL